MTTQELLNNLLNDPEVKELLTRLNNENSNLNLNLNAVQSNNGVNSGFYPGLDNRCCPPCSHHNKFDPGIAIALFLLLLLCGCGCGGAFLCC